MPTSLTATRVARSVHAAEHAIDDALLKLTDMIALMVQGRRAEHLAAEVGQDALERAVTGMHNVVAGRRELVAAHKGLAVVAENQNLGWRMDGPMEHKEEPPKTGVVASREVAA